MVIPGDMDRRDRKGSTPGRSPRTFIAVVLSFVAAISSVRAISYYLTIDVPATIGGVDYTANDILRSDSAAYSLELHFGDLATQFGALHRRPDGVWLLASATPLFLETTPIQPHDVVSYDGVVVALYFDGGAAGIPDDVRVDALFLDPGGDPVFSFDVPVTLGGVRYGPSDLVQYSGGAFSLYWSAAAAGVPAYTNVVGADRDTAGALIVSFDVPTNIDGTEYMPGQLVRWNGDTNFNTYFVDPSWPSYAQLRDFGFLPPSGVVPDGSEGTTPLTVELSGGNLTLSWGVTCATTDTDYEVYEGALALPFTYNHSEKLCSTGNATTTTFPAPDGSAYYLVVPKNAVSEGSYGLASSGVEIPQGSPACLPQQLAVSCP